MNSIADGNIFVPSATGDGVSNIIHTFTTLGSNLTVADDLELGGDLTVYGNATITLNTTLTGTLDANSTADIADTLTLSKSSGTGLIVTSNANIGGELIVDGDTTLSSNLAVTTDAEIGGDLTVFGAANISDTLTLSKSSGTGLEVTSDVTIGGNTSVALQMNAGTVFQAGSLLVPTGSIIPYVVNTAPNGYLSCNGDAVSRITYATLFGIIGVTFGGGDGSSTFNVPDLMNRMIYGGTNINTTGGSTQVTLNDSKNNFLVFDL